MALQFATAAPPGMGAPRRSHSIPRVAQVPVPMPLAMPPATLVPFTSSSPAMLMNALPRGASPSRPLAPMRCATPSAGVSPARQHPSLPVQHHAASAAAAAAAAAAAGALAAGAAVTAGPGPGQAPFSSVASIPAPPLSATVPAPSPAGSVAQPAPQVGSARLWARTVSPLAAAGSSLAARASLQQVGALDGSLSHRRSRSGSPIGRRNLMSSWVMLCGADSPRQQGSVVRSTTGSVTPHYQARRMGNFTPRLPASAAAAAGAATAAAAAVAAAAGAGSAAFMSAAATSPLASQNGSGSVAANSAAPAAAVAAALPGVGSMASVVSIPTGAAAPPPMEGPRRGCSVSPEKPRRLSTRMHSASSTRHGNQSVPFPDAVTVLTAQPTTATTHAAAAAHMAVNSAQPTSLSPSLKAAPLHQQQLQEVSPQNHEGSLLGSQSPRTASASCMSPSALCNEDLMVTRAEAWERLEPGVEVTLGSHRLRCIDILGSGSYSVVWRAKVLSSGEECLVSEEMRRQVEHNDVALKDVVCKNQASLRQSLFEVQLLIAFERRMLLDHGQGNNGAAQAMQTLRLPRCFSYKVVDHAEGWCVRMAMSRLPGEQLDDWLRRAAAEVISSAATPAPDHRPVTWTSFLKRGGTMAERLVKQIGPALEGLAPIAWHRDVNSHNILVSDIIEQDLLDPTDAGERSEFWLCDLGLAVDSESWVSDEGAWRVTDIGGDCRYWPASSWMVHLYGAEYLSERPEFCRQYQTRLDVHGLGITAVELLCSTALAARSAGVPAEGAITDACWARLLDAWQRYHETVSGWWETIYGVFSTGGDFRPVHSWLVKEAVADQVIALLAEIREALRDCAALCCTEDPRLARLIRVVAELTDEASNFEIRDVCNLLDQGVATAETTARAEPPAAGASCKCTAARPRSAVQSSVAAPPSAPNSARPVAKSPEAIIAASTVPRLHTSSVTNNSVLTDDGHSAPATHVPSEGEIMALAAAEAQAGRRYLENLSPIPSIAAGVINGCGVVAGRGALGGGGRSGANALEQRGRQMSRQSRQVELAELREAQGQLRRDLEQLQMAKMRLQSAKQIHELRTNAAAGAAAVAVAAAVSQSPARIRSTWMGEEQSVH